MKALVLAAVLLAACAGEDSTGKLYYDNNDPTLAVGNGALMTCSCIFVMEMPEDFCRAWVKADPDVARLEIDRDAKTVVSTAFVTWGARAHVVDDKRGCLLE
jgi:hypothetical protein